MKKHILRLLAALMAMTIIMTGSVGAFAEDAQVIQLTEEQLAELTAAEETPAVEAEPAGEAEETPEVTEEPVPEVTEEPVPEVTGEPAPEVTEEPVPEVTEEPVPEVTEEPVPEVTEEPVPEVTAEPSAEPSAEPTEEPALLPQTAQELADCFGFELWEIAEAFELTEEELIALPAEEIALLYAQIVEMLGGAATFASEFEISADGTLTKYNGSSETVVIPGNVKVIGIHAFAKNTSIRYVQIPASVTAIKGNNQYATDGAFQNCTELRTVTIASGSKLSSIGLDAFKGCSKLESINLEAATKLETIGPRAFSGCSSLESIIIPGKVEKIDWEAFHKCSRLASVSLPDSLKTLGNTVFEKSGLKEVTIPGSLKIIPIRSFTACPELEKVVIRDGVEEIKGNNQYADEGAFESCPRLTTVIIESNDLVSIGLDAFQNCAKLKSINLEDATGLRTIGPRAFSGCTSLPSIIIPEGVEKIDWEAFHKCSELSSIRLPNTLETLGNTVFEKSGLKEVTIPGSLKIIPIRSFTACPELEKVVIRDGVEEIKGNNQYADEGAFESCPRLTTVIIESDDLVSIGLDAFQNCAKLKSINLEDATGLRTIGPRVFSGCTSLPSAIIPRGVEKIEWSAFDGCSVLKSVSLPDTLETLGENAFRKSGLTEVAIPGSLKIIPLRAFQSCASLTKITLGDGVEEIKGHNQYGDDGAFENCSALTTVVIKSDDLKSIGLDAFQHCIKLSSINLEDASGLRTIGPRAFHGCTSLTSVIIPEGVEVLDWSAFNTCTALRSVRLPSTLETMGEDAFRSSGLLEVTIPGSLKVIPLRAFYDCNSLQKVVIEDGVEKINGHNQYGDNGPFESCDSLATVIIRSDDLKIIGLDAFQYCPSLTSIDLPEGLRELHYRAFYGNTAMKNAYLPSTLEKIEDLNFNKCGGVTVWVYAGTPAHTYCINNAARLGFSYELRGALPTPTPVPTATPTPTPTVKPTVTPTIKPTATPTAKPTAAPTIKPTAAPTPVPDGELLLTGADELTVGKSITLKVTDENGKTVSARSLEWSTSSKSIATVSRGKVTAKNAGVVTITAENEDGVSGSIEITIMPKASSVTIFHDGEEAGSSLGVDISETDEVQLEAVVNPDGASQGVTWKSGSTKVAKVDENGLVTFLKAGKATITATAKDGSKKSDKITITAGIMAREIEITGAEEVAADKNITLKARVYPEKASQDVTWSSSDKSVATVSSSGKVTAKKIKSVESVIITATAKDGSGVTAEYEIWVCPAASSVTITIDGEKAGTSAALDISSADPTLQLDALVNPEDASQNVTWKSSSSKIATVDESGLVTGIKSGKATITATAADGSKKSDKITINVICAVQEIEISGKEELTSGGSTTLKASVYPENATNKAVSWKSSDTSIAAVDSKGKVSAKRVSSAESVIITAVAKDGSGVEAEFELWVYPAATSVEILMDGSATARGSVSLNDDSCQLEAVVYPEDASQTVTWSVGNSKIAKVDSEGWITPVKAGSTVVTATTANGKKASFTLTVETVVVSLSGIVAEQDSGNPIYGAKIILTLPDGRQKTAKTARDGSYSFSGLASGDCTIAFTAFGYESMEHMALTLEEGKNTLNVRLASTTALPLLLADVEIGSTNKAKAPDGSQPSGVPAISVSASSNKITVRHSGSSKAFTYAIDTYSHFGGKLAAMDMGNGEYTFLLMVDETSNFYPGGWYVVFRLNGSNWEILKKFDFSNRPDDISVVGRFSSSSKFSGVIYPSGKSFSGTVKYPSSSYSGVSLWEGGFSANYTENENGYYDIIFSTYEYPGKDSYNATSSKTRYRMVGDKLTLSAQWYEVPDYVGSLDEVKWIGSQPPTEIMLTQQGSSTCTAAAIAMMLRSYAAQNGLDYSAVTEAYVKSICWIEGTGVDWGESYNVGGKTVSMTNIDLDSSMDKKQRLIELLSENPTGIVIYDRSLPHALLLCGYDPATDTLYCIDPLNNSSTAKRIIPLAESRNAVGNNGRGSQQGVIDHITRTGVITSVS